MNTDEMQSIHQRLDRVEDKLNQIGEAVTRQVTLCGPARAKLDGLTQTLYGNGREGLLTRVDRLEMMRRIGTQVTAGVIGLLSGVALTLLGWLLEK